MIDAPTNLNEQRLRSYNIPLTTASPEALAWIKRIWSDPTLKLIAKDFFRQGEDPETVMSDYDDVFKGNPEVQYGQFKEDWEFTAP
jgi:hypothetical protein